MAQYMIQLPAHKAAALESYLKGTTQGGNTVERDGSIVTFGQKVYNELAAVEKRVEGHIDADGMLWFQGFEHPVGRL